MKRLSRFIGCWLTLELSANFFPLSALAESPQPDYGSLSRIAWAVECAGPMPPLLTFSLISIGCLTALTVLLNFYANNHARSNRRHESSNP